MRPPRPGLLPATATASPGSLQVRTLLAGSPACPVGSPIPTLSCVLPHLGPARRRKRRSPLPLNDMVGFPGFSLLDARASALLLASWFFLAGLVRFARLVSYGSFLPWPWNVLSRGWPASELKRPWLSRAGHASWSARQPLGDFERERERERSNTPVEAGTVSLNSTVGRLASVTHPPRHASPGMAGWTVQDRDNALTPVASRAAISVSGVTVSLAASWDTPMRCGREEHVLLPSLMRPSSSPAVRKVLLAGPGQPHGVDGGVVRCNADADAMCLRPPSMRSFVRHQVRCCESASSLSTSNRHAWLSVCKTLNSRAWTSRL